MKHNTHVLTRLSILIFIFSLPLQAAPDGPKLPSKVASELKKTAIYQEGAMAMNAQLPDVAVNKFRTVLADKKLSTAAKPYVTLALAEALIRSSLSIQGENKQAVEALKLLEDKGLKDLATTPIWKAEAMASLGRYQEAEAALSAVKATQSNYSEIQLARARVLIALARTPDALKILIEAAKSKSPKIRNEANLLTAEIHIDQGQYDSALKMLENIDGQMPATAKLKEYLAARLSLAEGKALDAVDQFQSLIDVHVKLPERLFHQCVLGLADAQEANNQTNDAIETLEKYIIDYPDAATLQLAFIRLSKLLPENLSNDHPSMVKLRTWCGESVPPDPAIYIPGDRSDAILPFQPSASEYDDLVSLALYHRAQILARSKLEKDHDVAMALLALLRSQHPGNTLPPSELYLKLASASLLDTAYLHLKQNNPEQATFTLSVMEKVAFSPRLKDQASILRGLLLAKEGKLETSLEAFDYARQSTSDDIANAANINAGIMALKATNLTAFDKVIDSVQKVEIRTSLLLERALWKCSQLDANGRIELDTFIINHSGHPRENEARMALAAACVNITPPDVTLAKAQIEIISPRLTNADDQLSITRILIRAEELAQNWPAVAAAARKFISTFKDDPNIPSIMLKQGEAHFHNEDYNQALRIFQEIPVKYPDSAISPYASFYAAMSARLGGTAQAREECIALFQSIIDKNNALSSEARIQQSRVLIDLRRYPEAEASLKPLLDSKKTPAPMHRGAGILMADCLHRQGSADSKKYEQAIAIYNDLLTDKDIPLAWKNRIHFLRGQTYESMHRISEAFVSYYDVVIQANVPVEGAESKEEWRWFYRCGFNALAMLETEKRWEAAVKLARHIASFNGPRAEEAKKRAHSLAVKHMIWQEDVPVPEDGE